MPAPIWPQLAICQMRTIKIVLNSWGDDEPSVGPGSAIALYTSRGCDPNVAFLTAALSCILGSGRTVHSRSLTFPVPSPPRCSLTAGALPPHFLCPPEASEAGFRTVPSLQPSRTLSVVLFLCKVTLGGFCFMCVCVCPVTPAGLQSL